MRGLLHLSAMSDIDYTFVLQPGEKRRYVAGPYDQTTHSPSYEIRFFRFEHVAHQIKEEQILMGGEGRRLWVWNLANESSWQVFVRVEKDGELVQHKD